MARARKIPPFASLQRDEYSRVNRMEACLGTSKKDTFNSTRLDFVREIEMWCSFCAVLSAINTLDHIIDFAELKFVGWSFLRIVGGANH